MPFFSPAAGSGRPPSGGGSGSKKKKKKKKVSGTTSAFWKLNQNKSQPVAIDGQTCHVRYFLNCFIVTQKWSNVQRYEIQAPDSPEINDQRYEIKTTFHFLKLLPSFNCFLKHVQRPCTTTSKPSRTTKT